MFKKKKKKNTIFLNYPERGNYSDRVVSGPRQNETVWPTATVMVLELEGVWEITSLQSPSFYKQTNLEHQNEVQNPDFPTQ